MIKQSCYLGTLSLLLLFAGCASVTTQPPATGNLPDARTPETVLPNGMPEQIADGVVIEPRPAVSANHAVIALLDRARLDTGAGQREAAGASLERALRIEPRNGWLWHELAQLRLAQGQYVQAISIAKKSISFAGRDRRLQALNWRIIGNARVAQGDPAGAEQAFKLAADFEK